MRRHARHMRGRGCRFEGGTRRFDRNRWLENLEEYQKDLEQEIADLADLIKRLKDEKPPEPTAI